MRRAFGVSVVTARAFATTSQPTFSIGSASGAMMMEELRFHRRNPGRDSHHPFSFSALDDGKKLHLVLEGDLDFATAPTLLEYVHEVSKDICVDLSCLDFVDSSGLSSLISMQKRARANDTKFTLRFPSGQFLMVLQMAGLRTFFDFDNSGSEPLTDPGGAAEAARIWSGIVPASQDRPV